LFASKVKNTDKAVAKASSFKAVGKQRTQQKWAGYFYTLP